MKKKTFFVMGMAALLLSFVIVLAACGGKSKSPEQQLEEISIENGYSADQVLAAMAAYERGESPMEAARAAAPAKNETTVDLSKDGKALAEKIVSLEKEKETVSDEILNEALYLAGDNADPYEIGQAAGRDIYEAQSKIDEQLKPLYQLADQLSNEEYRRYAEARGELPEKEFGYALTEDGKGVNITAYYELGGKVTIPAEIEGFPVIAVSISGGKWGRYRNRITSVVIPDTVTRFSDGLFEGLSGLQDVTLPKGLTSIPDEMFKNCTAPFLTSFIIPEGVKKIGRSAFYNCTSLTSVAIPDGVTTIGKEAFEGCTGLASVTIPDSVTTIDTEVFYFCTGLASVTIPDSVTTIGERAFMGCTSLTSVTISPVRREWYYRAFEDCPKLSLASQAAIKAAGYTGNF
ncbi:MAG: leucine-rich repeat domain-containing protein [Treponema sp.]|nr:leucine-rich repeat domain-containing protein [Treponema sp.]